MAEGLAKGVLGKDLAYNQNEEDWKEILIIYHSCYEQETGECSSMSYWSDEEKWIQFIMLQSGHGLTPKNYEMVKKEYDRDHVMPVWDGEPAYEDMPTSWPVIETFHGTDIVRKRAYWSLFAGSFGHTYGHCTVWCSISEKEKNQINVHDWYEAIHSEGAKNIKILRDFLETMKLERFTPCQNVLLVQEANDDVLDEHRQACIDAEDGIMCVYFPQTKEENIDVSGLQASELKMLWFNPRDGKSYRSNGDWIMISK
ncbi:MAG: DUF4038 domain-containing protein [Hespellia sp.]|nr:DUF4038 domain-containing protein [Hespellia sp.]